MLRVEDLHVYYGDSYVLQGVSLAVAPGAIVAVLGRNGAGKTTLMRAVIGFTPCRAGRILWQGRDITRLPAHEIVRQGIALVPQGRRIFASLTVAEHLRIAARPGPWTLARVCEVFPVLAARRRHLGPQLSGGEQQMLATARALVSNPQLLLLDEPSEGLAPLLVRHLGEVIRQLRAAGLAVLLVEQNLPFALALADEVYLMSKGRMVWHGTPQALQQAPQVKRQFLGV